MSAFVIHSTSTAYIIAQPRRVKLFVGDGTAHGNPWLHVKAPGFRMFAPSLAQARGSRRVPNCCVGRGPTLDTRGYKMGSPVPNRREAA